MDSISFNLDIVGGAVGSLCEAYREIVRTNTAHGGGHWVNLLFDHETDAIQVRSPYTSGAALQIRVKRLAPLWVRVPSWVCQDQIKVTGATPVPGLVNGYLFIAEPPPWQQSAITIEFPLPQQDIVLRYKTRRIRARLRGDAVQQMENFGQDLTFFDPLG
jgi:DUF1680 family protein